MKGEKSIRKYSAKQNYIFESRTGSM